MPQASKVLRSRNTLRRETIKCHYEIREFRKPKKRHLNKIAELKLEKHEMRRLIEDKQQQLFQTCKWTNAEAQRNHVLKAFLRPLLYFQRPLLLLNG